MNIPHHYVDSAVIAKSSKTSAAVEIHGWTSGMFQMPAATQGATTYVLAATSRTGTFATLALNTNVAVSCVTGKGRWQPLPSSCIGAHSIKFQQASSQSSAARTIIVQGQRGAN